MDKQYNAQQALGQEQDPQQQQPEGEDYASFIKTLPQEFQAELEEATIAIVGLIHSEEGMASIMEYLEEEEDLAASVGKAALKLMDQADADHDWSDSAKMLAGFFAVREISEILRSAGVVDLAEEEEGYIYEMASKNYIYGSIMSKPTQEEREAEAIRIQKEVEPAIPPSMKEQMMQGQAAAGEEQPQEDRGLLQ